MTLLLQWALPLYAGLALGVLIAASLMRSQAPNNSPRVSVATGAACIVAFGLLFAVGQTRIIELPALRIRGAFLKAGSPAVRYAPWLAWGVNLVGVWLIYSSWH